MLTFSFLALVLSAQAPAVPHIQPSTGRVLVVGGPGGIASNGALDLQWTLPTRRLDATPLFLLAYFKDPTEQRYVSTQATLVELDPRF